MATTPALAPRSRSASFTTIALTVLIVLLGAVALLLAVAVLLPQIFGSTLGVQSSVMPWLFGGVVTVGVLLTPFLSAMGRVGAIMLAVGTAGVAIGRSLSAQSGGGPAFDNGMIDSALMLLIPSGYFVLLFGVLRAMNWSRMGSVVVAVAAIALTVVMFAVPSPPVADVDMGLRFVTHGLFIVGSIVGIIAVMIEFVRHHRNQRREVPGE